MNGIDGGIGSRFGLSASELVLRDQVAAIAGEHVGRNGRQPLSRRQLLAIFESLAPLGYLRSILPDPQTADEPSVFAFAAMVEGLSPGLPLMGNHSVQRYLYAHGDQAQKRRHLEPLLTGRSIAGIAISESGVGGDLKAMTMRAERVDDGYVLNGRKHWVTHGMTADLFVVLAMADAGPTRFLVSADASGLTRSAMQTVGLNHLTFAILDFDNCHVGVEDRLAGEGAGLDGAKDAFPIARLLAGLQSLRLGEAALAQALSTASRQAMFGRRLIEAEIVMEGAARWNARLEAGRLLCYQGLEQLGQAASSALASRAKAFANEAALGAAHWSRQVLGAGALDEAAPIRQLVADTEMMAVVDGTIIQNRLVAGRKIARSFDSDGAQ